MKSPVRPNLGRSIGWIICGACVSVAVGRTLDAKSALPKTQLTDVERRSVGLAAAAQEPKWRQEAIRRFPADCWSQDDDFSATELKWVREEAARRRVSVTDVFRAIDEELHSDGANPPRKSNACPCKPRPFYP